MINRYGIGSVVYVPDGKHIYYLKANGENEKAKPGHNAANIKLYYATPDLKEKKEIPKTPAMSGIKPSPSGKYLLGQDENLIIMDSSNYETVRSIRVDGSCDYGWTGDKEIYYSDTPGEPVKLFNIETGVIKKTDIYWPGGLVWSSNKGKMFALWVSGIEDVGSNYIARYDYQNNESTSIITSRNKQGIIGSIAIAADNQTVYYVIKNAARKQLILRTANINTHDDTEVALFDEFTDVSLRSTKDVGSLLIVGDKDYGYKHEGGLYLYNISSGRIKCIWNNKNSGSNDFISWDYSPVSNKVIWVEKGKPPFKELKLE
jgi:hypothetical protein